MNTKLLRRIAKHVLAEPKRLYMNSYVKIKGMELLRHKFARCGTAACIAGWACVFEFGKEHAHDMGTAAHEKATRLLGLTEGQAARLFFPENWPIKFYDAYADNGKEKSAKVAVARIEHFIKTKGNE